MFQSLITTVEEGHRVLQKGFKNRQVACTLLNRDSSRSHRFVSAEAIFALIFDCFFLKNYFLRINHSIITFKLVEIPKGEDQESIRRDPSLIRYSKLSIIDLAGSERNNRTKTTGAKLKEAGKWKDY